MKDDNAKIQNLHSSKLFEENKKLKQKIIELEKNQMLFDTLLDVIPVAIYFKDINSKFIRASRFMAKAFEIKNEDAIIGKSDFDFQSTEHAKKAFADEQNLIKNGKPLIDIAEKVIRPDKSERWILSTKLPLKNSQNKTVGILGVGRDITKIKELEISLIYKNEELLAAEEELRQIIEELQTVQEEMNKQKDEIENQKEKIVLQNEALNKHKSNLEDIVKKRTAELSVAKNRAEESDKLKSAFLANMSHEIRTPMNSIVGFSRLLSNSNISKDSFNRYIELINTSADSLMTLINDILDLSKIQSGQLVIFEEKFSLNQLIADLYLMYNLAEKNPNITLLITNHVELQQLWIKSDIQRINQIMVNLLNNAYKFTKEGTIEFGIFMNNENLEFFVKDTGIGIPNDSIKYIFDRFRKIDKSKKNVYRGAGLGLTISKNIAYQLGGDLNVESIYGEGTTFTFYLPVSKIVQ